MIKPVLLFIALCLVATITAQQSAASTSTVCDVCTTIATQLQQYVNQSEPEIEKALVKLCSKLPPQIEGLCDTIVLVYGHQIIQALLKKATPEVICQTIKLCPKSINEETVKPLPNNLQCTLCKLLVGAAEQYLSHNKTEQQIMDALHKVCDSLPSMWKSQCKALVEQYTPQIIEFLKQKYPPEAVCKLIKLCPTTATCSQMPVQESPVPVTNDYCELCQQVVQWIEDYIEDNRTSAKIIEALGKVCSMTGQYESMCKALIPVIWQQLVQKMREQEPPAVVCKQLHLCANTTFALKFSSDLTCNGCKYLVAVVDNFITKESTEKKIVETVEKACNYFPAQYKSLCQAVIEQYGPQIIEQLVQKILDPTKVCNAVRACKSQVQAEEVLSRHGFKINMN